MAGERRMGDTISIAANVRQIRERMAKACARAGRPVDSVTLMAVSKMHPAGVLVEAAKHGITLFGENRVQEFATKQAELMPLCSREEPSLGGVTIQSALARARIAMIGHLQTNKAKKAAEIFSEVHSLDSLDLAERLNSAALGLKKKLPVLLEIKVSEEEAKTGLLADSSELAELLEHLPTLEALEMRGLMTVPPWDEAPEAARPYLRQLRVLRDRLAQQHPKLNFGDLSMGMTNDFETAIEEGSTIVRIGTAIFGKRSYK